MGQRVFLYRGYTISSHETGFKKKEMEEEIVSNR